MNGVLCDSYCNLKDVGHSFVINIVLNTTGNEFNSCYEYAPATHPVFRIIIESDK